MQKIDIPRAQKALEELRDAFSKTEALAEKTSVIAEDITRFESEIAAAGVLDYRDEKAMHKIAILKVKLEAARPAREATANAMAIALSETLPVLQSSARVALEVLQVIAERRRSGIIAALRSFCSCNEEAKRIANQISSMRAADRIILRLRQRAIDEDYSPQGLFYGQRESIEEWFDRRRNEILPQIARVEEILAEAVSKKPNLLRFLPMQLDGTISDPSRADDGEAGDDDLEGDGPEQSSHNASEELKARPESAAEALRDIT